MVYDVMNVVGFEFMKDGNGNSSVGERSKKRYRPLGAVFTAEGDFVPFLNACIFEQKMQFCNFSCNIPILQRDSVEIRQSKFLPVLADGIFKNFINVHTFFKLIVYGKFNEKSAEIVEMCGKMLEIRNGRT